MIQGRDEKGNIYVLATGNGGRKDDDCNCDGFSTSIFTISIGSIDRKGLSSYYAEACPSTLAVTFNGTSHTKHKYNKLVSSNSVKFLQQNLEINPPEKIAIMKQWTRDQQ